MNLRDVEQLVGRLSLKQLVRLDAMLHSLIEAGTRPDGRDTSANNTAVHKTYRSEMVRCGKQNCHYSEGKLHGPYWYAYWSEGGRTRSEYVGKKLPKGIRVASSTGVR